MKRILALEEPIKLFDNVNSPMIPGTKGPLFENVAKEHTSIELVYLENANHVLKYEPKPRREVTPADASATYSVDTTYMDPETGEEITSWSKARLQDVTVPNWKVRQILCLCCSDRWLAHELESRACLPYLRAS